MRSPIIRLGNRNHVKFKVHLKRVDNLCLDSFLHGLAFLPPARRTYRASHHSSTLESSTIMLVLTFFILVSPLPIPSSSPHAISSSTQRSNPPSSSRASPTCPILISALILFSPTPTHFYASSTHLSHISRSPQHRRHEKHVREGDPRGAAGPAEVLVAVDHHVCRASALNSHLYSVYSEACGRRERRTVPFYDGGILVEHCGFVSDCASIVEAGGVCVLPWLWPAILEVWVWLLEPAWLVRWAFGAGSAGEVEW